MTDNAWQDIVETDENLVDVPEVVEVVDPEPITKETVGLIYVGFLTDTFDVFGSKISIRTLKIGEELEAELLITKYQSTQEENRAYMTALVAACITSVNGAPLIQGLGPVEESLDRKFDYITKNWHWITIASIYDHYRKLVETVMESLEEVKKK